MAKKSIKYFVLRDNKQDGPFGLGELQYFYRAGALKPDDLCARVGDPDWQAVKVILPPIKKMPGLHVAGIILCILGAVAAVYFIFLFDVSLPSEFGRVANLDLLNQRQNGVILSAAAGLAGAACLIANAVKR